MFRVQCSDYLIDLKLPSSQPNDKMEINIITHFKLQDLARNNRIADITHYSSKIDETKQSHESFVVVHYYCYFNSRHNSQGEIVLQLFL